MFWLSMHLRGVTTNGSLKETFNSLLIEMFWLTFCRALDKLFGGYPFNSLLIEMFWLKVGAIPVLGIARHKTFQFSFNWDVLIVSFQVWIMWYWVHYCFQFSFNWDVLIEWRENGGVERDRWTTSLSFQFSFNWDVLIENHKKLK